MIYLGTYNDMIDPEETTVIHDYVADLIDKVKSYQECNTIVPFRITGQRDTGFTVKVSGLYAHIYFKHMPWRYTHRSEWHAIFPKLIDKTFLCQIHEVKEKPLAINIDANIPQFQKPYFLIDQAYKGIITRKFHDGLFLDLGYHFDWQCGSIISPIFKQNLIQKYISEMPEEVQTFEELEVGQVLEVLYWGVDKRNRKILSNDIEQKKWITGETTDYKKKMVTATVTIEPGQENVYSVEKTDDAEMPTFKVIYGEKIKTIRKAVSLLEDQDIIHCEVSSILTENNKFLLKWDSEEEVQNILAREKEIEPAIEPEAQDIQLTPINQPAQEPSKNQPAPVTPRIGSIINFEVRKRLNANRKVVSIYYLENSDKSTSKLHIYNPNYRITEYEKKHIENNLIHKTILQCQVLKIEDDMMLLRWHITDEELKKLLH